MFQNKFNKYLRNSKCSAKTLSAMTGISEATISRYRTGKTVPSIESGNIENIANALAELHDGSPGRVEIYEDLLVAAYEDLDMVDYQVYCKKLSRLIYELEINMSALADNIHISVSHLSKICRGKSKARNPVYIAEGVAKYVAEYYSEADKRNIVKHLIQSEDSKFTGFSSKTEYYKCIRRWLLEGESEECILIDNLLYRYEEFDKNKYLPYSGGLKLNLENEEHRDNNQTFYGLSGLEEAAFTWIDDTLNAQVNDEIFIFDEISSPICRKDSISAYRWISTVEKLIQSGKRIIMVHNLEKDLYSAAREMLMVLPLTMSNRIQHFYINEPKGDMYRDILYVSSDAMLVGNANGDNLENCYYGYMETATAINKAWERAEAVLKGAQQSHVLLKNRSELMAEINSTLENLEDGDTIILYFSSLPLATMDESLLKKTLKRNGMPQRDIVNAIELYRKEREIMEGFVQKYSNCSIEVSIDYIKPDRWNGNPACVESYTEKAGLRFACNYDEYKQHIESTEAYAGQKDNIKLNLESMRFFKNMDIIIVPGKYAATTTKDAKSVNTSSFKKPIVDSIEELLFIINPRNAKKVQADERRKALLRYYKGMVE